MEGRTLSRAEHSPFPCGPCLRHFLYLHTTQSWGPCPSDLARLRGTSPPLGPWRDDVFTGNLYITTTTRYVNFLRTYTPIHWHQIPKKMNLEGTNHYANYNTISVPARNIPSCIFSWECFIMFPNEPCNLKLLFFFFFACKTMYPINPFSMQWDFRN